ncbi:36080_t:CDS:2, partial [Racocetra persica]
SQDEPPSIITTSSVTTSPVTPVTASPVTPVTNLIEIDSDVAGDNNDVESCLFEPPKSDDDISTELLSPMPIARSKKAKHNRNYSAKANSKHATKKQVMKEIESDSDEIEDNIDAELSSSELSRPITQSKKKVRKLSDISNHPLVQTQESEKDSRKKNKTKANVKCITKKQAMKKTESKR